MLRQLFNWRVLLSLVAILIASGTILYSSYLAKKIERDEIKKVGQWVEASQALLNPETKDTELPFRIIQENTDIPIIWTNEKDSVYGYRNIDTARAEDPNSNYLQEKLAQFRSENKPVIYYDPFDSTRANKYYFGHSRLLQEVRYYPIVQLVIVGLFIAITLIALRTSYRSTQNGVWAGMAKETAHQLGTPVSSLEGWVEILKETHSGEQFVAELEKDVSRLRLVSDRFGKIGSTPKLQELNIVEQIGNMVEYVRKRAPGRVKFWIHTGGKENIQVHLSGPLFDWVIENLLKNALDAMEGKGEIRVDIQDGPSQVVVDVADSGKGISKAHIGRVFKPGFTTKKRGWGLGLSLSKRIVEQYHKGSLTVKNSEPGKGTTFRIVLKKHLNLPPRG